MQQEKTKKVKEKKLWPKMGDPKNRLADKKRKGRASTRPFYNEDKALLKPLRAHTISQTNTQTHTPTPNCDHRQLNKITFPLFFRQSPELVTRLQRANPDFNPVNGKGTGGIISVVDPNPTNASRFYIGVLSGVAP